MKGYVMLRGRMIRCVGCMACLQYRYGWRWWCWKHRKCVDLGYAD